jgi:hypothetical protein
MTVRAFSFGAGVQSTACLVLAAQGQIDFQTFLFANTGDDSEDPRSLAYLKEVAIPYAEAHGLRIVEVAKRMKDGTAQTIWHRIMREGSMSEPIPVRIGDLAAPGKRSCTYDWKIQPIAKWFKAQGCTTEAPGIGGIGISLDEYQRAKSDSGIAWQKLEYPLIDLRITREGCKKLIADAGLPVPPKSSCFFCPFHDLPTWQRLFDEQPELFAKAVLLEKTINERRARTDRPVAYLTRFGMPLDQVVTGEHHRAAELFEYATDHPEWGHSCGPFACTTTDKTVA